MRRCLQRSILQDCDVDFCARLRRSITPSRVCLRSLQGTDIKSAPQRKTKVTAICSPGARLNAVIHGLFIRVCPEATPRLLSFRATGQLLPSLSPPTSKSAPRLLLSHTCPDISEICFLYMAGNKDAAGADHEQQGRLTQVQFSIARTLSTPFTNVLAMIRY